MIITLIITMPQENARKINKSLAKRHLGGARGAAEMGLICFLLIPLRFSCGTVIIIAKFLI